MPENPIQPSKQLENAAIQEAENHIQKEEEEKKLTNYLYETRKY